MKNPLNVIAAVGLALGAYGIRSIGATELPALCQTSNSTAASLPPSPQGAVDRIVVRIVQLLLNPLLAPDVEVVKPPLPHPMVSVLMNG